MEISSNFSIHSTQSVRGPQSGRTASASGAGLAESTSVTNTDKLDLSPEAQGIGQSQPTTSEIRVDKIASLRRAIAEGNYETPEKVSIALDRLLEQFSSGD